MWRMAKITHHKIMLKKCRDYDEWKKQHNGESVDLSFLSNFDLIPVLEIERTN
jgi:hypothetical protein